MKKPKFLQRYLDKREVNRHLKKIEKAQSKPEYQIKQLNLELEKQRELIKQVEIQISQVDREKRLEVLEEEAKEAERTNPYKADKWKVVYDPQGKVSTVYLNGQELFGAREFNINFDGTQIGDFKQIPVISYEGHGSVEIITESE